jgi:hypothetical protein
MRCNQELRAKIRILDPPAPPSAAYDAGLRALGLLDFVRLDLRSTGAVCREHVADLIANYHAADGRSFTQKGPIEVCCGALAKALCLPGLGWTASSHMDPPVVAFAAKEFMKAYILRPLEAGDSWNRKVASNVRTAAEMVMGGRAIDVDWSALIWVLVEEEIFDLSNGRRPNSACYYGAYLQRLMWLHSPDGVLPPPKMPASTLCSQDAQRRKQSAVNARNKHLETSLYQSLRLELDRKMQQPSIDDRSMKLKARYTELEEKSLNDALVSQKRKRGDELPRSELDSLMKKLADERSKLVDAISMLPEARHVEFDARSKQLDVRHMQLQARSMDLEDKSKRLDAKSKMTDARWKQIEARSAEFDAKSKQLDATHLQLHARSLELEVRSSKLEARSTELEALAVQCEFERINIEQYKELHDKMHAMEVLNQALITQQREANDELKRVQKELLNESERLALLQNDREAMESLNQVLITKEVGSNNELQVVRKRLIDVSQGLVPPLFTNLLVIDPFQQCRRHTYDFCASVNLILFHYVTTNYPCD